MINNKYTLQHRVQQHYGKQPHSKAPNCHYTNSDKSFPEMDTDHQSQLFTHNRGGGGTGGLTSQSIVYISVIYSQSMTRQSEKGCCQMEN